MWDGNVTFGVAYTHAPRAEWNGMQEGGDGYAIVQICFESFKEQRL